MKNKQKFVNVKNFNIQDYLGGAGTMLGLTERDIGRILGVMGTLLPNEATSDQTEYEMLIFVAGILWRENNEVEYIEDPIRPQLIKWLQDTLKESVVQHNNTKKPLKVNKNKDDIKPSYLG